MAKKPNKKPFSWVRPFKAAAEVRRAKKKALAGEYQPVTDREDEGTQVDREARMEAAEAIPHAADRSYLPLPNDGTFQRQPMRYDE